MRVQINGSSLSIAVADRTAFIKSLFSASLGRFVGITFNKVRSDGEIRVINGKVFEDTLGEKDTKNGTVTVISVNDDRAGRGTYRSIPIEGITKITIAGQTFDFLP